MATLIESPTPTIERLLEAVQNTLKKIASMNEGIELCRQTLEPEEDENEDITIWSYKKMKRQMTDDLLELLRKMDLHFKVEDTRQAA
jgi:predicted transcriptional regulator